MKITRESARGIAKIAVLFCLVLLILMNRQYLGFKLIHWAGSQSRDVYGVYNWGFARTITVPKENEHRSVTYDLSYHYSFSDTLGSDTPISKLQLSDVEADDGYYEDITYDLINKKIQYLYYNSNEEGGGNSTTVTETYSLAGGTQHLRRVKRKIDASYDDPKVEQQEQQNAEKHVTGEKKIAWLLAHRLSWTTARRVTAKCRLQAESPHQKYLADQASKKRSEEKYQRENKEGLAEGKRYYKKAYVPQFSDTQWRKYITLRATQLHLAKPQIVIRTIGTGWTKKYDRLGSLDEQLTGILGGIDPKNTQEEHFYFVISNGVEYLVVLPSTHLLNTEGLSLNEGVFEGDEQYTDYLRNLGKVDYENFTYGTFIMKNQTPSSKEVAGNIMLIAPESADDSE
ncbi:hypothetical protein [Lapidilactobacillus bayanensis]|uniref:hypothetical protein n=1 Tax=Lapidilactobacillus bayanensis TaxID=2485998 RepID=UPI000F7AB0FF|nr:hypothetical protein [Lapidilactobacillus bayanensis]